VIDRDVLLTLSGGTSDLNGIAPAGFSPMVVVSRRAPARGVKRWSSKAKVT
jgi:hypothetical protein